MCTCRQAEAHLNACGVQLGGRLRGPSQAEQRNPQRWVLKGLFGFPDDQVGYWLTFPFVRNVKWSVTFRICVAHSNSPLSLGSQRNSRKADEKQRGWRDIDRQLEQAEEMKRRTEELERDEQRNENKQKKGKKDMGISDLHLNHSHSFHGDADSFTLYSGRCLATRERQEGENCRGTSNLNLEREVWKVGEMHRADPVVSCSRDNSGW